MNQDIFEKNIKENLTMFGEDINREGLLDTPKRVYESYKFLLQGYNQNPKEILEKALFSSSNKSMVVVKDIDLFSMCEHHMLPIIGKAHIAYIPNGKVVGLSKIPRIVDVFSKRLQIQEELTEQLSSCLQETLMPLGVGVVIKARHMCMEMRGVEKTGSHTITTSYKGFFENKDVREEFLAYLN